MIRVLIAEDQGMVRGALKVLLDLEADIEVVGEAGRGDEVVALAHRCDPDVALLDIEMPGMDGLDAAAALHAAVPSCVILILTTFGRPGYLRRAMEAGASGFLVKDGPVEELAAAIRRAVGGDVHEDTPLAARRHGHVAADEERQPAEHLLLGQLAVRTDELPDAISEFCVVGHGPW